MNTQRSQIDVPYMQMQSLTCFDLILNLNLIPKFENSASALRHRLNVENQPRLINGCSIADYCRMSHEYYGYIQEQKQTIFQLEQKIAHYEMTGSPREKLQVFFLIFSSKTHYSETSYSGFLSIVDAQNQNHFINFQQFEPLYSRHLSIVDAFCPVPRMSTIERFHCILF